MLAELGAVAAESASLGERHLRFWEAHLREPAHFVYVIQGDPGSPIKVGIATKPRKRMSALQVGNPQTLRLLHVIPGDVSLENELHRRAKSAAVRGEWFHGEAAELMLLLAHRLALAMIECFDGSGAAPDYRSVMPDWEEWWHDPWDDPEPEVAYALEERQGHVGKGDWPEIAMLWIDGLSTAEIAERFHVSTQRLSAELRRMRQEGGYELSPGAQRTRDPYGYLPTYKGRTGFTGK